MSQTLKMLMLLTLLPGLSGCENAPTKQQTGAAVGGVLGGVLGSQIGKGNGRTLAIILGTLAGGAAGSYVGGEMDEADRLRQQQALEYTPTNQVTTWVNPDNQQRYEVTPTHTYQNAAGQDCRDYTTTIYVDGRSERANGTACRNAGDGSWTLVN